MEDFRNLYSNLAISQIPRLLSQMDRNPNSSNYGCFDRSYWHYKVSDFSNARLQEAVLTLALIFSNNYPNNIYFGKEKIKQLTEAGISFLTKIQNKNGSFNEYYPFENSFVVTAFPLYAISEALIKLKTDIQENENIFNCIKKAGNFLLRENDFDVANHQIGAAIALYNLYLLTKDEKYKKEADSKMNSSLKLQSDEGWFYEYGGPDFGYLTLAIDYLAKYYKKTKNANVKTSINKAIDFYTCFIHPDNTIGGEYGSRNTAYVIPHGIEIAAKFNKNANAVSRKILIGLSKKTIITPETLDDRFLLYNLYTYLQAYDDYTTKKNMQTVQKNAYFKESGLVVRRNKDYFFISNLNKGGVFKLFDKKKLVYSDCGFLGELKTGIKITTHMLSKKDIKFEKNDIYVKDSFYRIKYETMSPLKNILLRTFLSIGKNGASKSLKRHLQKRVITGSVPVPIFFERKIDFSDKLTVSDTIKTSLKLKSLYAVDNFSLIYVPSSRFFQISELNTDQKLCKNLADVINSKGMIKIKREIEPSGDVSIKYL